MAPGGLAAKRPAFIDAFEGRGRNRVRPLHWQGPPSTKRLGGSSARRPGRIRSYGKFINLRI
jgi:hypothetical protein